MAVKERSQIKGTDAQIKAFAGHNGVLAFATDTKSLHVLSGTAGTTTEFLPSTKVATKTELATKANTADVTASFANYTPTASLATVATSGSYNDLSGKPVVDSALSSTSENPVQNKVINSALNGKLSTSGGTMTGDIQFSAGDIWFNQQNLRIRGRTNDTYLELCPGPGSSFDAKTGASLMMTGRDYTGDAIPKGCFFLTAANEANGHKSLWGSPDGSLTWDGTFSATTLKATSDKRKKTCITKMSTDLSSLNAYRYKFKETSEVDKGFHVGLIAQEVEKILPEAVSKDDKGFLTLDYNAVVAVLVDEVNQLKSEIKQLKVKLS